MDDLKAFFNIVLLILFVAGSLLGPLVERWRRKKEAERRKLEGRAETEEEAEPPPPPPAPPHDGPDRPRLPYEEVLEDVFGSYIERRRREAEAKRLAEEAAAAVEETPAAEEEAPPPHPEPERRALVSMEEIRAAASAEPAPLRRGRSLDELLFRNPRLTPGARLIVAAEVLGTPRSRRRR